MNIDIIFLNVSKRITPTSTSKVKVKSTMLNVNDDFNREVVGRYYYKSNFG